MFLLPQAGSILTPQLPVIKPGTWLNTKQPRRLRQIGIQSAPEEHGYAHCPWSNLRYSADPLQAILSHQVVPSPQTILKLHRPSSLDQRACHRLPLNYDTLFVQVCISPFMLNVGAHLSCLGHNFRQKALKSCHEMFLHDEKQGFYGENITYKFRGVSICSKYMPMGKKQKLV